MTDNNNIPDIFTFTTLTDNKYRDGSTPLPDNPIWKVMWYAASPFISTDDYMVLEELLSQNITQQTMFNIDQSTTDTKQTALTLAAKHCHFDLLKLLLQHNASLESIDVNGDTIYDILLRSDQSTDLMLHLLKNSRNISVFPDLNKYNVVEIGCEVPNMTAFVQPY